MGPASSFPVGTGVAGAGRGRAAEAGIPPADPGALLPKGPSLRIWGGGAGDDYFAFNLHINGVNSRPGRSLWNLPGSCSLLCGFPTCLRASRLPVVWPRWGRGVGAGVGVQTLATGFPRTNKGPSCPPPGPTGLPAAGCAGGLPRGLVGGSRLADGLPPLSLPESGEPSGSPSGPPLPPGLARGVPAPLPSSPSAGAGAWAAVGRQRAVPSHWSQIIASCFVVWCLGPGASHLWGRAVARASQRNYPPPIAAATEPPASRPRGLTHTAGRTAAPPAAQTQGAPLPAPPRPPGPTASRPPPAPIPCSPAGLPLGQGPFWSEDIPPYPVLRPREPDRGRGPGHAPRLANIWTADTPVRTRPQLWLERPATLIPERKHSTQASIPTPFSYFSITSLSICWEGQEEERMRHSAFLALSHIKEEIDFS